MVREAGIHYVCLTCWEGFAIYEGVQEQCLNKGNDCHLMLLSKEVEHFLHNIRRNTLDWKLASIPSPLDLISSETQISIGALVWTDF